MRFEKLVVCAVLLAAGSAGATWSLDGTQYLTDGAFKFKFDYVDSAASPKTIRLVELTNLTGAYHDLEMSGIEADTGLRPVAYTAGSNKQVANVTFPATVQTLNGSFEGCPCTTNLVLPRDLVSIGAFAFKNCKPTTCDLTLPAGLKALGSAAFQGGGYTNIVLDSALVSIAGGTFSGCSFASNNLVLPPGLVAIEGSTFQGSAFGGTIIIPPTVAYIGQSAFENATRLGGVDFSQATSLTNISLFAFKTCISISNEFVFPPNIVNIDGSAFMNAGFRGAAVVVPRSLRVIGGNAFGGNKITGLDFSQATNLCEIWDYVFTSCPISSNLNLTACKRLEFIKDRAFQKVCLPKEFLLPDSVTNISGSVFADAGVSFEKVVLPKNLKFISTNPFGSWGNGTRRTAIYWRNCPETIEETSTVGQTQLFNGANKNTITNYIPHDVGWEAYATNHAAYFTLPSYDNSEPGSWSGPETSKPQVVLWYKIRLAIGGFVIHICSNDVDTSYDWLAGARHGSRSAAVCMRPN